MCGRTKFSLLKSSSERDIKRQKIQGRRDHDWLGVPERGSHEHRGIGLIQDRRRGTILSATRGKRVMEAKLGE
jgi:hypothetical protein